MPLDVRLRQMRDERLRLGVPPLYTLTLDQARAADLEAIRAGAGDPEFVYQVVETEVPGPAGPLPARIYRPVPERPLPALVYFYGGGWTLGSLDTGDAVCRAMANRVGCLVVAAGYRRAPEARFPAAVHDCHAATVWVYANAEALGVDAGRIAVGGDSAGGNLAAAVALLARERHDVALAGQLLVYPNTDYFADTVSLRESTDPALFNRTSVAWYWGHYLSTEDDGRNPLASPLRAESLAGLPPALLITAEYDPLRDEGEAYARRLADEGVPTDLIRYDGMAHGFFTMVGTLDTAQAALREAAARLRAWFTA